MINKNFKKLRCEMNKKEDLKIGMYLQMDQWKNEKEFNKAMEYVKKSDIDLLVFPEICYVPFGKILVNANIAYRDSQNKVIEECLKFSKEINRAVVISTYDRHDVIYSVYANANVGFNETDSHIYIKHTMTPYSAFDFTNYREIIDDIYKPIRLKGNKIGLTICYDCNNPLFSRMYGVQDIDIILNSTGGNVVYDKWYRYNQVRAIENQCYTLVTMGGDGRKDKPNSYVYGFNSNGKRLVPTLLNSDGKYINEPGTIYVYDLSKDDNGSEIDKRLGQLETENKYQHIQIPAGKVDEILGNADEIEENLYVYKYENVNIVFIVVEDEDIFKPETVLSLMYSDKLKNYSNKRYVVVNKYNKLDKDLYETKLSVVLKVRAMESFCAVILESETYNKCYQTGSNKTAQVIAANDGCYGLDLKRMTGPESIWKNKGNSIRASWRENYEVLLEKCIDM